MTAAVLDASVVLLWYDPQADDAAAAALRAEHRNGRLQVVAPHLLFLEVLNVAARRWRWPHRSLEMLGDRLGRLGFEVAEPSLGAVAEWAARGLTAYDASYVALAEERAIPLLTTDDEILDIAGPVARALRS